tara:strand:- start:62 stop:280 length:219 start_codon:yes stop_codon:yes gene_type:complete
MCSHLSVFFEISNLGPLLQEGAFTHSLSAHSASTNSVRGAPSFPNLQMLALSFAHFSNNFISARHRRHARGT